MGKWLSLGLGKGKYKMSPAYLTQNTSEKALRVGGHVDASPEAT